MVKLLASPRRKRTALYAAGAGAIVLIGGFVVVYFVLFPTSSPKPFKLASAPAATTATTAATPAASGSATGTYSVAAGSQAGYRVREQLAFLPAQSDAVGRTSQVTGSATLTSAGGTVTVTAASFDVAVSTLTSDRSMRDEKIHEIGLESSRYPTATFELSKPLVLPASVVHGAVVHVPATGVFNIHGVARRETIPVEMRLSAGTLAAVGSLTFPWSAFGMSAPSVGGFVTVTEHATMEFDLRLARA
jgi:polyisoprenoid-binding protein YceI